MRRLLYLVILFLACGCVCSSDKQQQLDSAGALLADNPVEAFERLSAIDISMLSDSGQVAQWALLYNEALIANDLYVPSDSIINIARSYYEKKSRTAELARIAAVEQSRKLMKPIGNPLVVARYIQKEREYQLYREKSRSNFYALLALAIACVAMCVFVWLYQRLRIRELRNRTLVAEASAMKTQLSENMAVASKMQTALSQLLNKRFSLIDSLCEAYYESQGIRNQRNYIAAKVKTEIDSLRSDSSFFEEMESAVNECLDNLLVRLKNACPDIKNEDYRLAVYLACGLSPRTIGLIIGESVDVVYKRKSRLKQRLKVLDTQDGADFMSIF